MSTLHDRLAELAEDAPPGGALPGVWTRGRRIARTRSIGTAVIAAVACLAVLAIGLVGWGRGATAIEPPAPGSAPALPTRLYAPSRWLPDTDGHPIGPLAVVIGAPRGADGSGYVAVSAATGEYRFLDLPGQIDTANIAQPPVALSDDGTRLAYWTGAPAATDGPADRLVSGVAVYDTVTGKVRRRPITTEHGLLPRSLLWAADDLLYLGYGQLQGAAGTPAGNTATTENNGVTWDMISGSVTPIAVPSSIDLGSVAETASGGRLFFMPSANRRATVLDLMDPDGTGDVRIGSPTGYSGLVVLDPTRPRLVGSLSFGSSDDSRSVQPVGLRAADGAGVHDVPGSAGSWLLGRAGSQLVVAEKSDQRSGTLYRLNPDTGERTRLASYAGDAWPPTAAVAADVLEQPPADRPAPPTPLDPRVLWGGIGASVVVAAIATIAWRRRVGP